MFLLSYNRDDAMKEVDHFLKAEEIMESIEELADENGKHVVSIVELCYGAAHHFIAAGCEQRYGRHHDTHVGTAAFLRERGEDETAIAFERLDTFRHGRWYGNKGNGKVVRACLDIVGEIREWARK